MLCDVASHQAKQGMAANLVNGTNMWMQHDPVELKGAFQDNVTTAPLDGFGAALAAFCFEAIFLRGVASK